MEEYTLSWGLWTPNSKWERMLPQDSTDHAFVIVPNKVVEQEVIRLKEAGSSTQKRFHGQVWICSDYNVIVNQALEVNQYPLYPKLITCLKLWLTVRLSLSLTFPRLTNRCSLKKIQSWSIPTLLFGVASAPTIIRRAMDVILHGIHGVISYINDILIIGATNEERH